MQADNKSEWEGSPVVVGTVSPHSWGWVCGLNPSSSWQGRANLDMDKIKQILRINYKMSTYSKLSWIATIACSKWSERKLWLSYTLAEKVHWSSGSFKRQICLITNEHLNTQFFSKPITFFLFSLIKYSFSWKMFPDQTLLEWMVLLACRITEVLAIAVQVAYYPLISRDLKKKASLGALGIIKPIIPTFFNLQGFPR